MLLRVLNCVSAAVLILVPVTARCGDVIPPASQRFAAKKVTEAPDFQKHLVPLLGKLGCNGRACHGSFQGRGGFQLSLFGYDFDMDHKGLLERADLDSPADSYVLHKPTLTEPHEGGQRMKVGSWEYQLFLRWIQEGAKGAPHPAKLLALEVTPREVQFSADNQKQQLKAVAVWEDGSREDVTCLSRFKTNDDAIAKIDDEGLVTSGEPGDSHVVVFYDNAVVAIPVLRPVSSQTGSRYPEVAAQTEIDRHVVEKLRKLGIVPSEVCDDAEFLRRVSLDVTGTLPTAESVRAFLKDDRSDKRARKVDELLKTPAYVAWWTTQLCDWTGCNNQELNNVNPAARQNGAQDWYDWIFARVTDNVAYDKICEQIILANGQEPDESYQEYCHRMSQYAYKGHGAAAEQSGLIYYWGRKNFRKSEDRAIGFAYTFMGTRIQCAQCHKHPFDVWTQKDFQEFEQFFDRVRFSQQGADRNQFNKMVKGLGIENLKGNEQRKALEKAIRQGKTIPYPDIVVQKTRNNRRKDSSSDNDQMARLLGEQEVNLTQIDDPRTALMDWLRNSPTRLFAKAFVNRVWANYFNRGIVEPTDDLSLANPPCNQALLDYLVEGFIAHDYDMHWLHREICLSETYQRDWRPNSTNTLDERNFSRAVPRRLPAEVAYDALVMATASDAEAARFLTDVKGHATANAAPPRNAQKGTNYILSVFGRSLRESNCDCDRSSEASLLQTLFVRNDEESLKMLERRDGWLNQLNGAASSTDGKQDLTKLENQLEQLELAHRKAVKKNKVKFAQEAERRIAAVRKQIQTQRAENRVHPVKLDLSETINDAYLRTLGRYPSSDEQTIALSYLKKASNPLAGLKDVMWALINTKEFIVNH